MNLNLLKNIICVLAEMGKSSMKLDIIVIGLNPTRSLFRIWVIWRDADDIGGGAQLLKDATGILTIMKYMKLCE